MTSNTLSILPEFEVFQFLIVLDLFIAFNLIPKKTPEVLFTSYMAFVLPTLYTRGSGNLTTRCPTRPMRWTGRGGNEGGSRARWQRGRQGGKEVSKVAR